MGIYIKENKKIIDGQWVPLTYFFNNDYYKKDSESHYDENIFNLTVFVTNDLWLMNQASSGFFGSSPCTQNLKTYSFAH